MTQTSQALQPTSLCSAAELKRCVHKGIFITLITFLCVGAALAEQHVQIAMPNSAIIVLPGEGMTFRRIAPSQYSTNSADFFLLETEVTNEMFARYLRATGRTKGDQECVQEERRQRESGEKSTGSPIYDLKSSSLLWTNNNPPKNLTNYPVALITFQDAVDFCRWLSQRYSDVGSFRLPNEEEWKIAAYGDKRNYPWGNNWDIRIPYVSTSSSSQHGSPVAVDAPTRDVTPDGIRHLWGNVNEYIDFSPNQGDIVWMGASFKTYPMDGGWPFKERQGYWGFTHNRESRMESTGFRVLLNPKKNTQPSGTANWSQPICSGTNATSGAAGSRR